MKSPIVLLASPLTSQEPEMAFDESRTHEHLTAASARGDDEPMRAHLWILLRILHNRAEAMFAAGHGKEWFSLTDDALCKLCQVYEPPEFVSGPLLLAAKTVRADMQDLCDGRLSP
jgi:hypothetical protein